MQTDPIGYYDSMNLYAYCGNNPLNYMDPMGLCKDKNWQDYLKNLWQAIYGLADWTAGNKPGHLFTIGVSYGQIIMGVPVGVAGSFDRLIMGDGRIDWFFTGGIGFSTPGTAFSVDRGYSQARTKADYMGPSTSLNVDMFPVGVEAGAPGWNPENFADRLYFGKGGVHSGEGINFLWNYTRDIGD